MRAKKPQSLEKVHNHDTGRTIELFLDRDTHKFFYRLDGERVEEADFAVLKRLAQKAAKEQPQLVWEKRINVSFDANRPETDVWHRDSRTWTKTSGKGHMVLEFSFDRFEQARRADGVLMTRGFEEDLEEGELLERKNGVFDARVMHRQYKDESIPYDEKTWTALGVLFDALDDVAHKIEKLMKDPKKLATTKVFQALPAKGKDS